MSAFEKQRIPPHRHQRIFNHQLMNIAMYLTASKIVNAFLSSWRRWLLCFCSGSLKTTSSDSCWQVSLLILFLFSHFMFSFICCHFKCEHFTLTGCTPLVLAAGNGHVRICRLLIDHGADLNITTRKGFSAAQFARRRKQNGIALLLENLRE